MRGRLEAIREAIALCAEPRNLRRTIAIALVVGTVLTAINQLGVLTAGKATLATYLRCGANYLVPFVVSNLGLLTGRPRP